MDMNGGSLSFLANQLVRNSMGNAINKSDPDRMYTPASVSLPCVGMKSWGRPHKKIMKRMS